MKLLHLVSVFMLLYTVTCRPGTDDTPVYDEDGVQNDDYEENYVDSDNGLNDNEDDDVSMEPEILTEPQTFIVNDGETIYLPCNRTDYITYVTIWKKNGSPIYQDSIHMGTSKNTELTKNGTLIIKNISSEDEGDYLCQVLSQVQPSVIHTVISARKPKIIELDSDNKHLSQGDTLTLHCNATGLPEPRITWSKDGISYPQHDSILKISNVGHENNGVYQCLADNKAGAAHDHITISVTHKPVIRIEKVTSGNVKPNQPYSIELQCIVHGNPEPKVIWFKDHSMIDAGGNIVSQKIENSYNLIINAVTKSDYGKYKCRAENAAGDAEKHVMIEGRPGMAKFESKEHVNNEQQGTKVTWKLESVFPVNKYTISYKNKKESNWSQIEKTDIEVPNGSLYTVTHFFTDLEAGEYEARINAVNSEGTSEYSKIVTFAIKKHHHKHHHINVPQVIYESRDQPATAQEHTKPKIQDEIDTETEKVDTRTAESSKTSGSSGFVPAVWILCISAVTLLYRQ